MMDIKDRLNVTSKGYNDYVKRKMPKSHTFSECVRAFLVGGAICVIGQAISTIATELMDMAEKPAAAFTSVVMVFIGAFLTGLGIYDVIGKFAGAGSIVPITGFANSIVSPAMEFRREGLVLGVGAKLFSVAGPVLVYGVSVSAAAGLIYYILLSLGWAA